MKNNLFSVFFFAAVIGCHSQQTDLPNLHGESAVVPAAVKTLSEADRQKYHNKAKTRERTRGWLKGATSPCNVTCRPVESKTWRFQWWLEPTILKVHTNILPVLISCSYTWERGVYRQKCLDFDVECQMAILRQRRRAARST